MTEPAWNKQMNASVMALVYRLEEDELSDFHVELQEPFHDQLGLYVDCRRLTAVQHNDIVRHDDGLTKDEMSGVEARVREHLCIEQLLAEEPSPEPADAEHWYPRQGRVRFIREPNGDTHPYVAISSDAHNAEHEFMTAISMTTRQKELTEPWAVHIHRQTRAIVGNLVTMPTEDFPRSRRKDQELPGELDESKMAEIAKLLEKTLRI